MSFELLDCLYGRIALPDELGQLAALPIVQRLRHVGLSNVDSVSLSGISGTRRYEHVVAVAYLSLNLGLYHRLSDFEKRTLSAAALLHDWAIGPFGHLLEEAAEYSGVDYDHEKKLESLLSTKHPGETGGVGLQIYYGRQTGLNSWAVKTFSGDDRRALKAISQNILGDERLGKLISGRIDIDNLDNVCRMAFHMGLEFDKALPLKIVQGIEGVTDDGLFELTQPAFANLKIWSSLRETVYQHLMPAMPDFSAKTMIIHAAAAALSSGVLKADSWKLTEPMFLAALTEAAGFPRETIERWALGEYWDTTPITWFSGNAPSLAALKELDQHLTSILDRKCFSYRIKDKRHRQVQVRVKNAGERKIGSSSTQWLYAISSPEKAPFRKKDVKTILDTVRDRFNTSAASSRSAEGGLF